MQLSIRKPHFWHPEISRKHYFGTMWHYLCVLNIPKKHYKHWGKQWEKKKNKNMYQFFFYFKLGPMFNFTNPQILDQFITLHIYIPLG